MSVPAGNSAPVGPAPTASLVVRMGQPSFPEYIHPTVRAALQGLTPFTFDATGSTGDTLTYLIEIGDGNVASQPVTVRPAMRDGRLTARVTVVDRFGRSDSSTALYTVTSISASYYARIPTPGDVRNGPKKTLVLRFDEQNGRNLSGTYYDPDGSASHFTGSLSSDSSVHLILDNGTVEFTGNASEENIDGPHCGPMPQLMLTIRGGSASGQTLPFYFDFSGC